MLAAAAPLLALLVTPAAPGNDNDVFFDGLFHDTQRALYRPDAERVNPSDAVTVRLRSYQFDLTRVTVEAFDGSAWQSFPMRYDVDDPTCDGANLAYPCVQWLGAIPANSAFVQYRFLVEDGTDQQWVGAAMDSNVTPGFRVYEVNAQGFIPFRLAPPTTGKVFHVKAEGSTQSLDVATAPCGIPGAFVNIPLSAPNLSGWRTGVLASATANDRLAFKVTVDGVARSVDRIGRPWTSAYDEVWLDRGLTYDVDPGSIRRALVDTHTHPIDNAQAQNFTPDTLTGVLDGHGVQLGLTSLNGSESAIRTMVDSRPDRFRGMSWALPSSDATQRMADLARVENDLSAKGFVGIKFHPVEQSFPADAAFMDAYLALAEKYRVPVVIHTEAMSGATPSDAASPERVTNLALRHPGVVVVMYHWDIAQCDRTPVLLEALRAPNVLVETSWSNAQQIRLAMCTLGAQRVMFGTDATTDGATHYDQMNIRTEACGSAYESYSNVISQMRGNSPYVPLGAQELDAWQRDSAVVAFDLSLRPVAPLNRPACTMPAPAISAQPFPYAQNACTDFPGGPVDAGVRPDASAPDSAVSSPDAAVSSPDAAVSFPDASVSSPDAAVAFPDASVSVPDAAVASQDAAVSFPDASVSFPDAAVTSMDAAVARPDASVSSMDASMPRQDGGNACTPGCVSDTTRRVCTSTGAATLECTAGTTCVDGECTSGGSNEPPPQQGPCACTQGGDDGIPVALIALLGVLMRGRRKR